MNRIKVLTGKVAVILCGALLGYASSAQPSVSVAVSVPTPSAGITIHAESDFYEPLAPQGEWVVVGSYGRCWRPGHVARDWRPYCNGSWQRTDDGWYWVSDEPWAWATYHYGRWDFSDQYGWYWVPQTQWAPAWVSWHEGGGYVGWAPLQPSVSISVNGYVGFSQSRIPPRAYVFVEQRHFMEPIRPATVAVNNTTIINKTTVNISSTRIVNNTVINNGPATTVIEQASGRKVAPVAVRELRQKEEAVVASRHQTAAPAVAKNTQNPQTPVRSEAEPAAKRAVAAPAPSPGERPSVSPRAPAPITATGRVNDSEKPKAIPSQAEPAKAAPRAAAIQEPSAPVNARTQREKQTPAPAPAESRSSVKPEPSTEVSHPAAIREPTEHKPGKQVEKHENTVKPGNKKLEQPAREKPAASEKSEPKAADENQEKKGKDQF